MPSYTLDPSAARQAGQPGRIQTTGRYLGHIVTAWFEESAGGASAFKFKFKAADGGHAEVAVWTHNKDGKPLSGFNLLQALMTCCELRTLESQRGQVEIYDRREKKDVAQVREVYPALAGKSVGLFLETETSLYTDDDGKDGEFTRMLLAAPFRATDNKMAVEILDKKPKAEAADRYEVWLAGKKPKVQDRRQAPGYDRGPTGGDHGSQAGNFADDEIPF